MFKLIIIKRLTLSIIFIGLFFTSSFGQNGSVSGRISNLDSSAVIPGVSVYLENTPFGSATNGSGRYNIERIPPGKYTLIASSIGYFSLKKDVVIEVDEVLVVDLVMIESITSLSGVTVITGGSLGSKDIPGSVQYISPKEIQKFSYTDINRTLRAVPGINLQEEDGFGLRPNIGLRGTGVERTSKITLMEDGVLMAPAPYAAPAAYYFPTIGRMQAVEILKGSSQIKYGPYTTGGAINLISTQIPSEFSGRIHILGGSYGGRNIHAYVGNKHKNVAYMVETFQYSSDGFKELDNGGSTGFNKEDYLAKVRVNTNPNAKIFQSLTFKVGQANETSNETYLGLTQTDYDQSPYRRYAGSQVDQMNTEQTQFSVTHGIHLNKHFSINTTFYRSDFKRNWYKLDKIKDSTGVATGIGAIVDDPESYNDVFNIMTGINSVNDDALQVKANNRKYYAQGIQTVFKYSFAKGIWTHNIDLGIRYHSDQMDRFQWVDEYAMDNGIMELTNTGTPGTESNRIETANAFAAYVQYNLKFNNFSLTPGVRYEYITQVGEDFGKNDPQRSGVDKKDRENIIDVLIPGFALDYQFNKYINAFIGIHKGFAPPGSVENTLPEQSVNYELGVRSTKKAFSAQGVIFFNDYSNLLGADLEAAGGAGSGDLFNAGAVETKGFEMMISYDLLMSNNTGLSMPLSVSYTYTDAVFKSDFVSGYDGWGVVSAGDHFPYLAQNQLSVIIGFDHPKFNVSLSSRYMDEMRTSPGKGEIPKNEKTDAYVVLDASASVIVHKHVSLFANATNMTNKVYLVSRRPAGLRPGMPRAFTVGLKADF